MKRLLAAIILLSCAVPAFADSVSSWAGDRLEPWKFRAVYMEKYFEYNTRYLAGGAEKRVEMLSGMDQDFIVNAGLPWDCFASAGAKFVFQKVTITAGNLLIDEQKVQAINITAGRYFFGESLAAYAGCRLGIPAERPADPSPGSIVDYSEPRTAVTGGVRGTGRLWLLSGEAGASVMTDLIGWTKLDAYAGLGFNWHDDPKKQVIEPALEVKYTGIYGQADTTNILWLIPQARINFYNDLSLIFGVEVMMFAENAYLNSPEKALYTAKIAYVINSDKRGAAAAMTATAGTGLSSPVYITGTAAPIPTTATATPAQVTGTAGN